MLIARHQEPHRHYHTMAHIRDCLDQVARSADLSPEDQRLLETAVWFHDAIYDPTRMDNEAESARLASETLSAEGQDVTFVAEVSRLILLTAGHEVAATDPLGARLVSIDLSILGAEPERYQAYAAAIRREYAHVPDVFYRPARAGILRRFVESERLFPDPAWASRLDESARANLLREIAVLEA